MFNHKGNSQVLVLHGVLSTGGGATLHSNYSLEDLVCLDHSFQCLDLCFQ